MSSIDFLDPNTWVIEPHEFRVYGDDRAQLWVVVDEEDYQWALQWRWCFKFSRKTYLRRAVAIWENRVKIKTISIYIHVEIMKRTGIVPPSPRHVIADHRDGDEFNCRRSNLRWATHSMNSLNRKGSHPHDLIDG